MDNQAQDSVNADAQPENQVAFAETPVQNEEPPKKKRKWLLPLTAILIIVILAAVGAAYFPKWQTAKYATSSKPVINQLVSEVTLLKSKTFNPNFVSADIEAVVKEYKDNLEQLGTSQKKVDDLEKQYNNIKNTKNVSDANQKIKSLFETTDKIILDNTKAIEERKFAAEALKDAYEKRDELDNYLRSNGATFSEAVTKALAAEEAAEISAIKIKHMSVGDDQKDYMRTIEESLLVMAEGYGKEAEALFSKDNSDYAAAQKEMNNKLTANNEERKKISDNYYKNSTIAKNFTNFETESAKLLSELEKLL